MFFGTIEVAWASSKDVISWGQGIKDDLWSRNKQKNRQLFDLGFEQVPPVLATHFDSAICLSASGTNVQTTFTFLPSGHQVYITCYCACSDMQEETLYLAADFNTCITPDLSACQCQLTQVICL